MQTHGTACNFIELQKAYVTACMLLELQAYGTAYWPIKAADVS